MQKTLIITALAGVGMLYAASINAQDEEKIDFETQIWPMVKESCAQCHKPPYEDERGRTRRPKAGLVVTNAEDFAKGAEDDDHYHKVIVAGEPDESSFLQRTLLPIDDDDHMPPEGKAPEWTDDQKALFEKWIAQGADFGDWEGASDEELEEI